LLQTPAGNAFLSLFGQAVKVKNTFIDDLEEEGDRSTDRAVQTCPANISPTAQTLTVNLSSENGQEHQMGQETDGTQFATLSDWGSLPHECDKQGRVDSGVADCCAVDAVAMSPMLPAVDCLLTWMPTAFPQHTQRPMQILQEPQVQQPQQPPSLHSPPSMPAHLAVARYGFEHMHTQFSGQPPACSLPRTPAFPPPSAPPHFRTVKDDAESQSTAASEGTEEKLEHFVPEDFDESLTAPKAASAPGTKLNRCGCKKRQQRFKIWCHIFLDDSMIWNGFDLNKKLIGHGGSGTRKIFEATDAKVRLRGRGSGHIEAGRYEAPVHLMLAVTSEIGQEDNFLVAMQMAAEHLQQVTLKYREFCKNAGIPSPTKPLFWIGELSEKARACMGTDASSLVRLGRVPVTVQLEGTKSPGKGKGR